ncbi:MAG: hypothetical protein WCO25_06155 [Candidatus Uhrbacteria bacterium]
MEGIQFRPEAKLPRRGDVAMIDGLLKSVVPDADFDGAEISCDKDGVRTTQAVDYSLSPDTLAVVNRIASIPGSEDLVATLVLRPFQKKIVSSIGPQDVLAHKLGFYLNRISTDRKMLATNLFQRELAKLSQERKKSVAQRTGPSGSHETSAAERNVERKNIDYLRAAYRPQWLANGGPIDPNSFESVPDSMKRWAADEVVAIRATFLDDKSAEHVGRGEALELFAGVELSRHRWLGAEISIASTVDDYRNGVDLIGEFVDPETGEHAQCALDLGSTRTAEGADKKLKKGKRGAEVQFFRSKVQKENGKFVETSLKDIPMVILGVTGAVLSELGAAVRRGETIGPDHPIGVVFLRQAEIQVGMQIRQLAADFVANALENMPSDPATLLAVRTYAERIRSGDDFLRDVSTIRDIMRSVPNDGKAYYLGPREATRLRHLLIIHNVLSQKIATVDETRQDVRRISEQATLTQRLRERSQPQPAQTKISPIGEIFLRVGRLGLVSDRPRGVGEESLTNRALGRLRLVRKRPNRFGDFLGRAFGNLRLFACAFDHR